MTWISPEDAWRRLEAGLSDPTPESLPRREAAGRVLAAPVAATVDLPPCDMSAMDGYVVSETIVAGTTLPVTGTIAAGDPPGRILTPGTAVRIMTGAPAPANAEAVVPVEQTTKLVDAIRQVGGSPKLTVFPEAGHGISKQVCEMPELWQWLFEQSLQERPFSPQVESVMHAEK